MENKTGYQKGEKIQKISASPENTDKTDNSPINHNLKIIQKKGI